MVFHTRTTSLANAVAVALFASGVSEKVDRCYLSEHRGEFYMGLTGTGADESAARADLRKKVDTEVKRLEKNTDLKPSQERRLAFLKAVYV